MSSRIFLAALAAFGVSMAQAADAPKAAPKPVEPPPKVEPGESIRPEVTITEGKDRTITEYRINGVIRAIKVQPKKGPAYYLVDREGTGEFQRFGPDTGPHMEVPKWVLYTW